MFTPTTKKYIYNRITWLYFVLRNVIAYGTATHLRVTMRDIGYFPIDNLVHILVLLWFQEMSGKIYDSYVQGIKL